MKYIYTLLLVVLVFFSAHASITSFIRDDADNCILPTELANHPPGANATFDCIVAGFEVAVTNNNSEPNPHEWDSPIFRSDLGQDWQNIFRDAENVFIGMYDDFTKQASTCHKNIDVNGVMTRVADQNCIDKFKEHLYNFFLDTEYQETLIGFIVPALCLQLDNPAQVEWGMKEKAKRHSFLSTQPLKPRIMDSCNLEDENGTTYIVEMNADVVHPISEFHLGLVPSLNATGKWMLHGKFTGILVKRPGERVKVRMAQLYNYRYDFLQLFP